MEAEKFRNGEVLEIREDVDETRTISFVSSTYARDRHGTVLNQANWKLKNFNKNPIIGYQHNVYGRGDMCQDEPNPDDVIGKGRAYVDQGAEKKFFDNGEERLKDPDKKFKLLTDITFEPKEINETADKVFRKVKFGTLRATSVGFFPFGQGSFGEDREAEGEEDQTYYYAGQELLEKSVVNVPSNPEALKKSIRGMTANALLFVHRKLGITLGDIEKMTVGDVLKALDGGTPWEASQSDQLAETIQDAHEEISVKQNNLNNIKIKQFQIKQERREYGL